jgi:hypothetical protein
VNIRIRAAREKKGSAWERLAVRKHLEGKARNLGDDVINARIEAAGARHLCRFNIRIQTTLELAKGFSTLVR